MYLTPDQKAQIIMDEVVKAVKDQSTIGNTALSNEEKQRVLKKSIQDALELIEQLERWSGWGV